VSIYEWWQKTSLLHSIRMAAALGEENWGGELVPGGTENALYFHGFASLPGPGCRPMVRIYWADATLMGNEVDI
jgi:hypothetical protein